MIVLDPTQEARCDQLFERLRPMDPAARKIELEQIQAGGEDDSVLHLLKKMLALPTDGPSQLKRIGDYEVLESLGEGGMGEVYLVQDRDLDRTLAAKVLRRGTPVGHVHRLRFEREAHVLGRLEHPNIVPIHSYGVTKDGLPFYTMKLVRGETLRTLIEERRLSRQALLSIFEKVCEGVAFAHSRDILHRDLKPENIMVGEFGEVQVLDWGIAKIGPRAVPRHGPGRADVDWIRLTGTGEAWGTPGYISPEQARGEPVNERTDIYGLGGVLFEMLTGRPPFVGETRRKRIKMLRVRGTDLAQPDPGWRVPWELRAVVLRAMHPVQDRRYQSVADLRDDVVRYRERQFLLGIRYSEFQFTKKLLVRHPRWLAAVLVCGLALPAVRFSWDGYSRQAADHLDAARQWSVPSPDDLYRVTAPNGQHTEGDADATMRRLVAQAEAWERALALQRSEEVIVSLATVLEDLRLLGAASKRAEYIEKANEIARRARVPYDSRWDDHKVGPR